MKLLQHPLAIRWLAVSFVALMFSVFLAVFMSRHTTVVLVSIFLAQAAGSVFFPILVGHFYQMFREKSLGQEIWGVYRELADTGILRIYKDREESEDADNAVSALRRAFHSHTSGTVRLVGVSLRVFMNPTGPFFESVQHLAKLGETKQDVSVHALACHSESPEVKNRAGVEHSPDGVPQISRDLASTNAQMQGMMERYGDHAFAFRNYMEAPYCTAVLFPDKCFYSPNILAAEAPARLPMLLFTKGTHAYEVIDRYFNHLWESARNPDGTAAEEISDCEAT